MHPQAFQGRVIGAPVARANIPCEALKAGLQFLKRPPPLPTSPPPSQLLPLTLGGRWAGQYHFSRLLVPSCLFSPLSS